MLSMVKELLAQLFKKPATNKFPVKYAPKSATKLLEKAGKGKAKLNPPVSTPERFRGRLSYNRAKCIMCLQCIRTCPAAALEVDEKKNRIKHFVSRCTFCAQCVDTCPVKALAMTNEFLLSSYDTKQGFIEVKGEKKEAKEKE